MQINTKYNNIILSFIDPNDLVIHFCRVSEVNSDRARRLILQRHRCESEVRVWFEVTVGEMLDREIAVGIKVQLWSYPVFIVTENG